MVRWESCSVAAVAVAFFLLGSCAKDDAGLGPGPGPGPEPCSESAFDPSWLVDIATVYSGNFIDGSKFNNTVIEIPPYTYFDTAMVYITGDGVYATLQQDLENLPACELQIALDKATNEPTLEWTSTGDKLVAAAIFSKRIKLNVKNSAIENDEDAVWGWHSGLGTGGTAGDKVVVSFQEGRSVKNGIIQESEPAVLLERGKMYYWLVWAWDADGKKITKASREIPILITDEGRLPDDAVDHVSEVKGTWILNEAIDTGLDEPVTDQFPVKSIKLETFQCEGVIRMMDGSGTFRTDTLVDEHYGFSLAIEKNISIMSPRLSCYGLQLFWSNGDSVYWVSFNR